MENRLTWFSLLNLFGGRCEGVEQLHEYPDNNFSHGDCRRDLGVYVKAIHKLFYRIEQINQCVVAVNGALDRLIGLNITKMRA